MYRPCFFGCVLDWMRERLHQSIPVIGERINFEVVRVSPCAAKTRSSLRKRETTKVPEGMIKEFIAEENNPWKEL